MAVKSYRLEGVEVQVARQCLFRDGESIYVRAKTFQVLLYLLQHRERLVPKQELFDALWTGTAVSDSSLVQCIIDLRKALRDDSRSPRYIKTVARVGYQFIGAASEITWDDAPAAKPPAPEVSVDGGIEVEEYSRYEVEYEESCETPPKPAILPRRVSWWIGTLATVAVAAVGFRIWMASEAARSYVREAFQGGKAARGILPHIEGRRPLAVMYFENQSGTAELDWLRAGLADMLTADLSRYPSLTVLSSQELRLLLEDRGNNGRGINGAGALSLEEALEIARKSRADVLVMGGFAKLGDRLRVNVQLHDGHSGRLLTAESILPEHADRLLSDVDLLSLKLAHDLGALDETRARTSSAALVMTDNLEAYRYYLLGVEKSQAYHTREAIALLQKAVALDAKFAMAYARIGYCYAVTWISPREGRPYLEKAFALSSRLTDLDRMYINAWYAIANLDYPAAVNRYRELIAAYPRETEAYARLGQLLRGEQRIGEAIAVLEQGMQFDVPSRKDVYNVLGGIYSQQGRGQEAIAILQRQLELAPGEPNAHDSLGLAYAWAGLNAEAEREYRKAIELDPAFDVAPLHLAILHFQMGRYRDAATEFQRVVQAAPSELQRRTDRFYLAQVQWRMGDRRAAEEEMKRAAAPGPNSAYHAMQLALWRGDREQARALVAQLSNAPEYSHRGSRPPYKRGEYYSRGMLALLEGENEKALEMFREALRHWPGWAAFDTNETCLADAYLQLGRWDEAIAEYRRILQSFPGTATARYHLASAYERSGRPQQARQEYTRFLDFWKTADPDGPEVQAARTYLARQQHP